MKTELYVFTVLCLNVFLAIYLEKHTKLKHLGAALLSILITAIVANIGLIPSASNPAKVYDGIFTYVAPASIFMLLLGVNIRELKAAGKPMLILFVIAAFGTCIGVSVADAMLGTEFGEFAKPIAGMITGTYTGGSINFNAVAIHYNMMEQGTLFASVIAVDNILTTVWMAATLLIPVLFKKNKPTPIATDDESKGQTFDVSTVSIYSLGLLVVLTAGGMVVADWVAQTTGIPSILILTTEALILAQFIPIDRWPESKIIGLFLVYLFLAVVGAYCELAALSMAGDLAITVLCYLSIVVGIHGVIIIAVGHLFKQDWYIVSIASQASIGGSSSALALAKSFGRNDLLLPAVLVGALGNALGTYLGFWMAA